MRITKDVCRFFEGKPADCSCEMKNMKLKFSDLWRPDGTIDRGPYLFWGIVLFVIKYNLDRMVAQAVFQRSWSFLNYFEQSGAWEQEDKKIFYLTMVALALPFIWMGVALSLRRLRSAGWPLGMVVLFFAPIINLVFFALLSVVPPRPGAAVPPKIKGERILDIPESQWGSAAAAILGAVILTALGTAFSVFVLRDYGGGLFIGMPFCLGLLSVLIYGYPRRRTFTESMIVCCYAIICSGVALLVFAMEGAVCILMAAPLATLLAVLGGIVAHTILQTAWWRRDSDKLICTVLLALPSLLGLEHWGGPVAPLLCVTTSIEVNAPPGKVWRHVVSFPELPPPKEWPFRMGIAYPVGAEIRGRGIGAVRHCNFSTGHFVEPIQVWDEPRLLKFSVTSNPPPMQEWTPYRHIHPPHLNGFLASDAGQFLLARNKEGGTHLEGTTWYRHHMWPVSYWQLWSDFLIHRIHLRVLNHVKNLAEKKVSP